MSFNEQHNRYEWSKAKGLMPVAARSQRGPQCALIPDSSENHDHIAVVYDQGDTPPEITIAQVSGTVHTVLANGIAVAIVARSNGTAPAVSDVLLVERTVSA